MIPDAYPERRATRPRPADRAVIQISRNLHNWLTQVKKEREQQLGRQVTFTEIIDQLREKAGAA